MKLTKERLKQIILEEMEKINQDLEPEVIDEEEKNVNTFRKELAAHVKDSKKFQGVTGKEPALLSSIIARISDASSKGTADATLAKLSAYMLKTLKI